MSNLGFAQFNTAHDCIEEVKKINEELVKSGKAAKGEPYDIISRTPFESLWPAKNINYNGGIYDTVAWGGDVMTPSGPLPACILVVRKDICNIIEKVDVGVLKVLRAARDEVRAAWDKSVESATVVKKPLRGPGWKPAPGFEDY